jgi:hypothetical protein
VEKGVALAWSEHVGIVFVSYTEESELADYEASSLATCDEVVIIFLILLLKRIICVRLGRKF